MIEKRASKTQGKRSLLGTVPEMNTYLFICRKYLCVSWDGQIFLKFGYNPEPHLVKMKLQNKLSFLNEGNKVNFIFQKMLSVGTYVYIRTTEKQKQLETALCIAETVQVCANVHDHILAPQPIVLRSKPWQASLPLSNKNALGISSIPLIPLFCPIPRAHYPVALVFPFMETELRLVCQCLK